MNKTNLHKLHQGYIINSQNRRSGKTTRLIYDIIGEIQLGDKKDIYINCVFSKNIKTFQDTFVNYFIGTGATILKFERFKWTVWYEADIKIIHFITNNQLDELKISEIPYYRDIVK